MNLEQSKQRALEVIARCESAHGGLAAAAGSALYPHVWTRDVAMATIGIAAIARTATDVEIAAASLELIARHQLPTGRLPLKVDSAADVAVEENSAAVDTGSWFAIAVEVVAAVAPERVSSLRAAARRALAWTACLDMDGSGLIVSPEASDWADMMPHRHHVLMPNVLYAMALAAVGDTGGAKRVRDAVGRRLWLSESTSAAGAAAHVSAAAEVTPEWGISNQYVARWGELPFFLPYAGFRTAGHRCDVVGNCLAIIGGVADAEQSTTILDYLDAVGVAEPFPSKTLYPPIPPGDPDYRDYFKWRNLCVPHHYQNGGIWPFCGGLHVVANVAAGRFERAEALLDRLVAGLGDHFNEWLHGVTGVPMGEADQLWSATNLLWAARSVETRTVVALGALCRQR